MASLFEIQRSGHKVIISSIKEEIRIINPHQSHRKLELEGKNYFFKTINEIKSLLNFPFHSIAELISPRYSNLKHIHLHIPFKTKQLIDADRAEAVKSGTLNSPKKGNALLVDSFGNTYGAKIRLKGDLGDHWHSNKKFSLRVYLSKNNSYNSFPYREFSLHRLRARQYPYEYLFTDILASVGLVHATHEIVKVSVNNQYWGFMDLQEHYGSAFLERQKLKSSLILAFGDERKWKQKFLPFYTKKKNSKHWLSHPRLNVKLSGIKNSEITPTQQKILDYIKERLLMPSYQSMLFDQHKINKLASLLAIWGNYHSIALPNSRFYFNPYTLKLEPIAQDQGIFKLLSNSPDHYLSRATNGFLHSDNRQYSENKFSLLKTIYQKFSVIADNYAQPFFRDDSPIDTSLVSSNFEAILANKFDGKSEQVDLDQYSSRIECSGLQRFYASTNNSPNLFARYTLGNIILLNLDCGYVQLSRIESCGTNYLLNTILSGEVNIYSPRIISISLDLECNIPPRIISVDSTGSEYSQDIDVIKSTGLKNPLSIEKFPNWISKTNEDSYLIKQGTYIVKNPIILHSHTVIEPGVKLLFDTKAFLVVRGDVTIGKANSLPVEFSGLNGDWKGVYFYSDLEAPAKVNIFNAHFSKANQTSEGILNLSGGINVYNSIFISSELSITDSLGEDSLNIIKSEVKISDISIFNSASDALDCDYCIGSISGILFKSIGGDGLDLSGSNIKVENASFLHIKDKAVSIGEKSNATINVDKVFDSYTAVAVKDGSDATINLGDISTTGPIVMSYRKKFIYDKPAVANIFTSHPLQKITSSYVAAFGTNMSIDGASVLTEDLNIDDLYGSGAMSK